MSDSSIRFSSRTSDPGAAVMPGFGHQLSADDPALNGLNLPAAETPTRWVLKRDGAMLVVVDTLNPRQRGLQVDFSSAEMRRRIAAGRQQPLAKACGLHKHPGARIVDATAGLGRDGWCLASLGAQMRWYERHPVIFAMLRDALSYASPDTASRVELLHDDGLQLNAGDADAIFLDPMFPDTGRRAAPALEMQIMQLLVGPDLDAERLWQRAMDSGARRVVLKRPPRGAKVRVAKPDLSFGGGRVVYDVYLRPTAA